METSGVSTMRMYMKRYRVINERSTRSSIIKERPKIINVNTLFIKYLNNFTFYGTYRYKRY